MPVTLETRAAKHVIRFFSTARSTVSREKKTGPLFRRPHRLIVETINCMLHVRACSCAKGSTGRPDFSEIFVRESLILDRIKLYCSRLNPFQLFSSRIIIKRAQRERERERVESQIIWLPSKQSRNKIFAPVILVIGELQNKIKPI